MHPRLQELSDLLDANRIDLRASVDSIPAARHQTRPAPTRWSVAEVLEHLGIVEQRVTGALRNRLAAAKAAGLALETDRSSILASFDVGRIVDRTSRITAGDGAQPKAGLDVASAWAVLEASRKDLRLLLAEADGFALGGITFPHPALGPLDMYKWIAFLAGHESRHAAQIREC